MMTSLVAAMAMSMAAPTAQQAEQCGGHYAFVSLLIATSVPETGTQADKDAAMQRGLPWFNRANDVLVSAGLKKDDDKFPEGANAVVSKLVEDVTSNKPGASEAIIKTISDCDAAYGFQPLTN